VHVGEHPCQREAPFEADRQIGHDAEGDHQQCQCTVVIKFLADLRPTKSTRLSSTVGSATCNACITILLVSAELAPLFTGRRISTSRLVRNSAPRSRQAGFFQRAANGVQIGRLAGAHLDQGAAGEIDAQIQAFCPTVPRRKTGR